MHAHVDVPYCLRSFVATPVMVTSFKDLKKQKNIFVTIPPVLHRSIWNFISEYPSQFNDLLNKEYPSLPRSAEKLFMMCDEYADNQRRKSQVWPLQNTLLILCPNILRDIAESGIDNSSGPHKAQRAFLSAVMKALASISKQMCEAATVCGVDMFKACAYVGDSSAPVFRYYLNLIQGNLQNLLFNPQQGLFLHQSSSALALIPTFTDLGMMVTCLVAQFRCNYRNSHIFSVCLNPSSPPIFRLAFIRSIHTLLEQNTLPSWPGPEAVHTYAPQLREIFQNVLPQLRRYDTSQPNLALDVKAYLTTSATATSMLTNKSKADRKSLVEMITHYQLMAGLIRLFEIDPMLAFAAPPQGKRGVTESLQLMTGLVSILQHQSLPNMPLHVSDVLLTLHRPDNIELWDPHDSLSAFGEISNQVTYSIALKLFGRKTSNPIQLLGLLKQILQYRTHFLKKRSSEAIQSSSSKIAPQMYTMLETVLLLFIRNTNVEAVTIAMSCFKYLVLEAELVMNPMEPSVVTYCPNLLAYQQLDQASSEPQIGRASQQKKVRSILRELVHTPGSALAWEDTYSSWRVTKSILLVYQKEEATNPPDLLRFSTESFPRQIMRRVNTLAQSSALGTGGSREQVSGREGEDITSSLQSWTNMTGFLCSLAGVSTKPSSGYSFLLMSTSNSSINSIDGEVTPPTVHRNIGTSVAPTIKDPNHRVRRSSSYHGGRPKSVVNVSPARTSALESSCVVYPSARLSGEGMLEDPSGTRTSQTETFITELIFLLSCHNEAIGVNIRETVKELVSFELSPPVYPYLFRCMVVETSGIFSDGRLVIQERHTALIDQLVSIVHHILESRTEDALEHLAHVKMDDLIMNFIIYVNSLDSTTRSLTISVKLCHLIETLMQHSRDLSFRQEVQFRNQVAEHLTGWVKGQVCLSASSTSHMENVQNDLDLGAMKALGQVLNGLVLQPRGMTGDVFEQKSKLFQRHFTKFMDLIHSLNHVDWSVLSPIHTHSLQRHVTQLKEATICAMAHMLTANIDSGLTHAIGLGYHEDLRTRTSFIEVLTSILKEGAQFSSLAETALADRLNQMLDLVTTETADGDLPVVMALIDSVPPENVDELAEDLVTLFDSKHKLAPFLNSILNTEMDDAESGRVDTLFRGNTIACKVLSSSFKTFGLYYLQSVVRPLILQLLKIGDKDFEVDPARMSDTSRLAENQANLLDLVQTFCNTIISSLSSVSLQLRTVCHTLYSVVAEHYPDGSLDTVSSALFLRFINPAIVSPQSYNLVQGDIPNGTRRGLTFISKVLQNLANHIEFKKEAHMQVFNQFLRDNFERTRNHALHLSAMGPFKDGEAVEYISFLKESLKHRLHSLLWTHQDKMAAYAASTRTSVSARQPFHQLNTLLAQLGAPNYRRKRTSYTIKRRSTMVSSQLEAFLETMAGECDEKALRAIKASDIFYSGGVSKLGNAVFYFIARKFRGDQISFSHQMLYHIMTLLKSCTDKSFEIVIDLTQATQINEPDLELLVKFAAYIPELVMSRIEAVYVYNTNLAFRNYAHKLSSAIRIFSHIKGAKRVMLVDTLSQFSSHIDISELKLPSGTMVFEEEEGKVEFNQAHFLVTKAKTLMVLQVPARLQVCPHGLVVHMTEKMKVFESLVLIKEIYHISDIREVYSEDKESLTVRLVEGSHPLKFTVNKADEIVKAIGTVISRWQNQQPVRNVLHIKSKGE
jgi:neurofibromin 1